MKKIAILLFFSIAKIVIAQTIIPKPVSIVLQKDSLSLQNITQIIVSDSILLSYNEFIDSSLLPNYSATNSIVFDTALPLSTISLKINSALTQQDEYVLRINKESIEIEGTQKSIFYAIMSLNQLLFYAKNDKVACQIIHDYAAFTWRGMHLDVVRHFFPVSFIKKYIDILALHKMNTFHWHLTDDQGWRIEIKKYPKLTQIGSTRSETMLEKHFDPFQGDHTPYGGFYTQEEIKEVVSYAEKRQIVVVPEIEMPGHSIAALSAYPYLSCTKSNFTPRTSWGVSDDIFCTNDSVFHFIYDVLDEVIALFPSSYIHIGGDEAPKIRWKQCKVCQQNIKNHNLKDEHELQSFFISKIDSFLNTKQRKLIGWDEILEGGLAQHAAVMSWRGEQGGIQAATTNHAVVMCPGSHCYFDHYQGNQKTEPLAIGGYTTLKKVYDYNPIPKDLPQDKEKYILGAQGNVWTEYIQTQEHVMYMAMPRLCALSEVLWSPKSNRNYSNFTERLIPHFELLNKKNIRYANAMFDVQSYTKGKKTGLFVELLNDIKNSEIRFTADSTIPTSTSKIYTNVLPIQKSSTIKAQTFIKHQPKGAVFSQDYFIHKAIGAKIENYIAPSESYNQGGIYTLTDGIVGNVPWTSKEWLGWYESDMSLTMHLNETKDIFQMQCAFLKAAESWIHLPEEVEVRFYNEKDELINTKIIHAKEIERQYDENKSLWIDVNLKIKKINFRAKPLNKIPAGMPGSGLSAWLFCSEIALL
ncbi:MAG: family 20 glycosylhydrolase [Chitinophagaceae bacterium]